MSGIVAGAGEPSRPRTIVAFGDSTTLERARVEAVYAQRLPALLAARGFELRVVNRGRGGDTTRAALRRFERDVLGENPDLVLIQFGVNDASIRTDLGQSEPRVAIEDYLGNLTYFARRLQRCGIRVVFLTPNPIFWTPLLRRSLGAEAGDLDDPWGLNRDRERYAAALRHLAGSLDVPIVDVYGAYGERERVGQDPRVLLLDGVHPNDRGHALVAEAVAEVLLELWAGDGEPPEVYGLNPEGLGPGGGTATRAVRALRSRIDRRIGPGSRLHLCSDVLRIDWPSGWGREEQLRAQRAVKTAGLFELRPVARVGEARLDPGQVQWFPVRDGERLLLSRFEGEFAIDALDLVGIEPPGPTGPATYTWEGQRVADLRRWAAGNPGREVALVLRGEVIAVETMAEAPEATGHFPGWFSAADVERLEVDRERGYLFRPGP